MYSTNPWIGSLAHTVQNDTNITVHHKYNDYDPEFTLFIQVHSGKRIQGRSPSFKCATGEQLLSGVSRPMNNHSDTI